MRMFLYKFICFLCVLNGSDILAGFYLINTKVVSLSLHIVCPQWLRHGRKFYYCSREQVLCNKTYQYILTKYMYVT